MTHGGLLVQATEWVIVPVYVPTTAAGGKFSTIVGFHDTEKESSAPVPEKAVLAEERLTACAEVNCPGVEDARPVLAVASPDQ